MITRKQYLEGLFRNEIDILTSCKKTIDNNEGNELLIKYKELVKNYEKLLKITQKVFRISDTQGRILAKRESEIRSLLDNANQGFLTFGKNLIVNKEYSAECIRIFQKNINNINIAQLLSGSNTELQERIVTLFNELFSSKDIEIKMNCLKQLPDTVTIYDKHIKLEFKLIDQLENEEEIVQLILSDITDSLKSKARIEYLSYYDSLTALFNRAYIDEKIPELITPSNLPFSIILADMNGLKLINDVFGHEKGDQLLIKAADILRTCCRKTDLVARWGGDEFLVILPNTSQVSCQKIIERIKRLCKEEKPNPIEISAAMGSATMENPEMPFSKLFLKAEQEMYKKKILENKAVNKNIITDIEKALQEKCFEAEGHIARIKSMSVKFAKLLGIANESTEMKNLILLASLHDVGKLAMPKEILSKKGELTPEDWEIIKGHSEIGYRMAQAIGEFNVAKAILAMHEKWDGTGYPNALSREEIPFISRLLSIIDAFDVMTHDRIYKNALSIEEALEEIRLNSGRQFDPALANSFLNNINNLLP